MGRHDGAFHRVERSLPRRVRAETLAVICDLVGQGMRIIEVGANEGYHTVFAGWCVGPSGLVHAYEPYVHARAWLERNVARLGWGSRVRVHSAAVAAAASGTATLFVPAESAENQGVAGLRMSSELQTGQALVDVVILDAEHGTETIAFIKMDVQGGEAEVIHGAERLLRRCQPALYFEVGDDGLMTAIPAAEEHGYVVRRVFPFSRPPFYSLSDDIAGQWYRQLSGDPPGSAGGVRGDAPWQERSWPQTRRTSDRDVREQVMKVLIVDNTIYSGKPLLSFVPRRGAAQVTYFDEAPYLKPLHTSLAHKVVYRVLGRRPATAWALNRRLLEAASECRPDVVIVAKGAYVFPKTLRRSEGVGRASCQLRDRRSVQQSKRRRLAAIGDSGVRPLRVHETRDRERRSGPPAASARHSCSFAYNPTLHFPDHPRLPTPRQRLFLPTSCSWAAPTLTGFPYMDALLSIPRLEACPLWWLLGSAAERYRRHRAWNRASAAATGLRLAGTKIALGLCARPTATSIRCGHSKFRRAELFCARSERPSTKSFFAKTSTLSSSAILMS